MSDETKLKMKMDYAWNWFKLHAEQRMKLFNYFLITTGILFTAFIQSVHYEIWSLALFVCVMGIFESIAYIVFDWRNRKLISYAADVLHKIEDDYLFNEDDIDEKQPLGMLRTDAFFRMRQGQTGWHPERLTKMKWWMRILYFLAFLAFVAGMFYVAYNSKVL
ncbi:hypothetical protein J0656_18520 [Muricauda ruestringensis]|uniref:SMODS and SLOG-associating 2TM effector domain-containing protein n=1 Tax=Flagellimonas aurea TaxID=2915619 RepID=A0ABS3GAJ4_9FLAO|nr:hypothetical protein [Allomuricauda aurea]MBO0356019.1 hypothetical protein [Allomuricauda aurea]